MTTTPKKIAARAIADVAQGTVLAMVDLDAPPERVFRALLTEEMTAWWGSDDTYRTTGWRGELTAGGHWRAEGRDKDGGAFSIEGNFEDFDPPRKVVQTWRPSWDGGHTTMLTYHLDPLATGTRLVVRHEGFSAHTDACASHALGWERVLGWLDRYLQPAASGAGDRYFLCRLLPPRPTFAHDLDAEEQAIMRDHGAYLRGLMQEDKIVFFGPVGDPQGPWGVGLVRAPDEAAAHAITDADPAIRSGRGFRYEVLPMIQAVLRG